MGKLKVVLKGHFDDGNETRNIFHATTDSDDDALNVNAMAEWMAEYVDAALPDTSENFSYYSVDVYEQVGTGDDWFLLGTVSLTGAVGVVAGGYNTGQDAVVMIGKTPYPKTTGKKFVPGFADTGMENSHVAASFLTQLALMVAAYITDFVSTEGVEVIPSIFKKALGTFHTIVGGIAAEIIGSQRRRKPGVGS